MTEAQPLMVIVPESATLTAEVALENKDIGFIYPGQQAEVKLETFPYTRYGTLNATVEKITQDAVQDEKKGAIFMVTLRLHETRMNIDGKTIHLSPGMNLSAEIKTGKRRIIEFITSPVQRLAREGLRER
ncbi:HlyD family efflux transporter periplasmic adaptor subunit [Brenneria alni]|uniref:HlyD family efflux transporter periplasmic adaptor subunit n=1 Tax=Brenneria alni TaxID=71656 RepID=UPI00196AFB4C|nr:HlyD family efflux transporter periplasmic adaptor subunit [Brenneria alni]